MRQQYRIGLLLLLLPVCLPAEGTGEVLAPDTENRAIALQVEEQLERDERIDSDDLVVTVEDGTVTIVGTVDSYEAQQSITADALAVPGVRFVNNLTVVKHRTLLSRSLEEKIREAFESIPGLDPDTIGIERVGDSIILSGRVDQPRRKNQAAEIAAAVTGIDRIVNDIVVVSSGALFDDLIAQEIRFALERNEYVNAERITVAVSEGNVLLAGTVESSSERRAAFRSAFHTGGVREIEDRIEVVSSASGFDDILGVEDPMAALPFGDDADERIAGDVEAALMRSDPAEAEQIIVRVEAGVVTLGGAPSTRNAARSAYTTAVRTEGVRMVIDRMRPRWGDSDPD